MRKINVEPGAFPYRAIEGPTESRYLTWVRNHSNYLAQRGFVDYMRIVAILVRGILINFLTLLPHLMVAAVLLAVAYGAMLRDWGAQAAAATGAEGADLFVTKAVSGGTGWVTWVQETLHTTPPFVLTPIIAVLALAYYLAFPIVIRLFKVMSHKRSLQSGRESSVKLRDLYERSFGGLLIAILGAALVEVVPLLLHYFHEVRGAGLRDTLGLAAGGTSIMALSGAGKVVSKLGAAKQKIALAILGLLGLLVPLLVILYVGEFVVYTPSAEFAFNEWGLLVTPAVLVLGSLLALGAGWRHLARREWRWLASLLLFVIVISAAIFFLADWVDSPWKLVLLLAFEIWGFCWLSVDINLTSVLGLYRDRLASAYLVGEDTGGDVDIEEDVDLHDICLYETLSIAPYHLINVAHNLQASKDISIRERNSDFFIFSKRFVGGARTGYCRSESLERVFPQMDLATAMAISAAAAAPNMGTNTSRALVALLTLLNVRLGYWVPNPGRLCGALAQRVLDLQDPAQRRTALQQWAKALPAAVAADEKAVEKRLQAMVDAAGKKADERLLKKNLGFNFGEVFEQELSEVRARWANVYDEPAKVRGHHESLEPTPDHGLVGVGFSGGGIRSATINMGITQAFDRAGVFRHVDYISSVSGGGYFASSLSTLMRSKTKLHSEIDGRATIEMGDEHTVVRVDGKKGTKSYRFRPNVTLSREVRGGRVSRGDALTSHYVERAGLQDRFAWRVPPSSLRREMLSQIDETSRWVNLSDGGHLENLAALELLRRRCRFIIVGDGAADPNMFFGNLAALLRYARIDLGIEIDIDPAALRLSEPAARLVREGEDPLQVNMGAQRPLTSRRHYAVGRIFYPRADGEGYEPTVGRLLYLKSSCLGDEEEIIQQYRNTHGRFPHESTADQFFDEGQFEAYRALGYAMGRRTLAKAPGEGKDIFESWFDEGKPVGRYFEAWMSALETDLTPTWRVPWEDGGSEGPHWL